MGPHWQRLTEMLREEFPIDVPIMDAAREDVLTFLNFPQENWCEIRSTNPLKRLKQEIKSRNNVEANFPNYTAITRLVSSQLLIQKEEFQLERLRLF